MAVTALWQNQYALSLRKGPLDLTDVTTGGTSVDAASNTNAGVFTQHTDSSWGELGGDQHFQARTPDGAVGGVIGQYVNVTGPVMYFGMPVIGNPDFTIGQTNMDINIMDGRTDPTITGVGGRDSVIRGTSAPTTSYEFLATSKSLVLAAANFFQAGCRQETANKHMKHITLPQPTDGADPIYYGCFLRKMSTSTANSRMLSDAIGTEFKLTASNTEPLKVSCGLTGRVIAPNVKVSDINGAGTGTLAADFTLYNGQNYLLQDCVCVLQDGTKYIVVPISSFDITCSHSPGVKYWNSHLPYTFAMGEFTVSGSLVVPALGYGDNALSYDNFQKFVSDAGGTESSTIPSAYYTPTKIMLYWKNAAAIAAAIGSDMGASGSNNVPTAISVNQELHVRVNALINDISLAGESEATMTLSFTGVSGFSTAGAKTANAIQIDVMENATALDWGLSNGGTYAAA